MSLRSVIVFDCDSTLSTIEGVDELARLKGDAAFQAVEEMTHAAMDGKIPLEEIFARRLDLIQPTRDEVAEIGQRYLSTIVPGVEQAMQALRTNQPSLTLIILSGGFRHAIRPLATHLGISRVEAVDLYFNDKGAYQDFDRQYPTTRNGGKPEVIRRLKTEFPASRWIMVGDGVSDLETKPEVDLFIGFGGVVAREKVKAGADHFITSFQDLPPLLA